MIGYSDKSKYSSREAVNKTAGPHATSLIDNRGLVQRKPAQQPKFTVAVNNNQSQTKQNSATTETVQRMKVAPEKNYQQKLGKSNKAAIAKVNRLIEIMGHALQNVLGKDDTIHIEIINDAELTPAWNHHKGSTNHPGNKGDIGVQLNKWYLEKASLGELLGMFIHEIGVHTLADRQMEANTGLKHGNGLDNERVDQNREHKNDKQINGKLLVEKYPNDIEQGKKKGRRRQKDHVNLAKSLLGGLSTRADHYIQLYFLTGDAIDAKMKGHEGDKALRELTQSFLFDLARLVVTDDGGMLTIFKKADGISQLMSYYQKSIIGPELDRHKWLKKASAEIISGQWPIQKWLIKQIATLTVSSNPLVQGGRSALVGLGTAIYVGGGVVAGLTSMPALVTGAAVGLGVWGLQKLFGV